MAILKLNISVREPDRKTYHRKDIVTRSGRYPAIAEALPEPVYMEQTSFGTSLHLTPRQARALIEDLTTALEKVEHMKMEALRDDA